MRRLLILAAVSLGFELVMAYPVNHQQDILNQLNMAQMEIKMVKNVLPEYYQNSLGENLRDASERIAYSLVLLNEGSSVVTPVKLWHCSYRSTFDGSFPGTGRTRTEALQKSMEACKIGRNGDAFGCNDEGKATCDQEQ